MPRDRSTVVAFLGIVFFGGFNAIAIKLSNPELPPFWAGALRLIIAAAILFALVAIRRVPLPRGRALLGSVLYGVLNFAAFLGFMYWGLQGTPAGLSMVILAVVPLLTLLLAVAHRLERFQPRSVIGGVIALAGIVVIASQRIGGQQVGVAGLVSIASAALAMSEANVVVKLLPRAKPLANNAVAMGVGAVVLLVVAILTGESFVVPQRPVTIAALAYLSVFGSVALFMCFLLVIERWSASATSYALLPMPIVATVGAAVLLGEPITALFVVGAVFVLVGVYVGAFARAGTLRWPVGGGRVHQRAASVVPEASTTLVSPPCP